MLKRLLRSLKALLTKKPAPIDDGRSHPTVLYGDMIGNVKIMSQYQLDKHTAFKPGESYRLGEMIVTVHANKESMLAAVKSVEERRLAKEKRLTERAEELMLMTPEELQALKLSEWLAKRNKKHGVIRGILGKFWDKSRYDYLKRISVKHEAPPPVPQPKEAPQAETSKIVEKVP